MSLYKLTQSSLKPCGTLVINRLAFLTLLTIVLAKLVQIADVREEFFL